MPRLSLQALTALNRLYVLLMHWVGNWIEGNRKRVKTYEMVKA